MLQNETTGEFTGVMFGFLRDIIKFNRKFEPHGTVFCFDQGRPLRAQILPSYKNKDLVLTEEDKFVRSQVWDQIGKLRRTILPAIGYENLFGAGGYEADDVMAQIALGIKAEDEAVIVTADHDLYQSINELVSVYHPSRDELIDEKAFTVKYKIRPEQWVKVKAIAGCKGDKVPGIGGIGEVLACKYLNGKLKEGSKARNKIEGCLKEVEYNRRLVELPFEGTPRFEPVADSSRITLVSWQRALRSIGIKSLRKMLLAQ